MDQADVDALASRVEELLRQATAGTVVTISAGGTVVTESPGTQRAFWERREQVIASFIATRLPPRQPEIRQRIEQGLRKRDR